MLKFTLVKTFHFGIVIFYLVTSQQARNVESMSKPKFNDVCLLGLILDRWPILIKTFNMDYHIAGFFWRDTNLTIWGCQGIPLILANSDSITAKHLGLPRYTINFGVYNFGELGFHYYKTFGLPRYTINFSVYNFGELRFHS
jgi:hypothetical protein